MTTGPVLGLELGEGHSRIALSDSGDVSVVNNSDGNRSTPSVVYYGDDDSVRVGTDAITWEAVEPDQVIRGITHMLSEKGSMVTIGNEEYIPAEVTSELIRKLRADAETYSERSITDAVVTVPATAGKEQLAATKEAASRAGFEDINLVSVPVAATAYLTDEHDFQQAVLVVDIGPDTVRASVVGISDDDYFILGTSMQSGTGVSDINSGLMSLLAARHDAESEVDILEDTNVLVNQEIKTNLRKEVEEARKGLVTDQEVEILSPFLGQFRGNIVSLEQSLLREEFERIAEGVYNSVKKVVEGALKTGNVSADDLDGTILLGEATNLPGISDCLATLLGHEPISADVGSVAKGAAVYQGTAPIENDTISQTSIHEVAEHSTPCEICGEVFRTAKSYANHVATSHYRTNWICELCGERYDTEDALNEHLSSLFGIQSFGIELGTNGCRMAVVDDEQAHFLSAGVDSLAFYSVSYTDDGEAVVRTRVRSPVSASRPQRFQKVVKNLGGDSQQISVGGSEVTPVEAMADLFRELRSEASQIRGHDVREAVISIPGQFKPSQRDAVETAADVAGFDVVRLIGESTAAGLAHAGEGDSGETVAIFSLYQDGIGISLRNVHDEHDNFELTLADGLGVDALVDPLVQLLETRFSQQYGIDIRSDGTTNVQRTVENDLSALQDLTTSSVSYSHRTSINADVVSRSETIRNEILLDVTEVFRESLRDAIRSAIESSPFWTADIDAALIVGSGPRVPFLKREVELAVDLKPRTDALPVTGAALADPVDHSFPSSDVTVLEDLPIKTSQDETYHSIQYDPWSLESLRDSLAGPDLSNSDLRGSVLTGSDLSYADLSYANLSEADLRDIDLTGALLFEASLDGSDLRGANLSECFLRNTSLEDAVLLTHSLLSSPLRDISTDTVIITDSSQDDGFVQRLRDSVQYNALLKEADLPDVLSLSHNETVFGENPGQIIVELSDRDETQKSESGFMAYAEAKLRAKFVNGDIDSAVLLFEHQSGPLFGSGILYTWEDGEVSSQTLWMS